MTDVESKLALARVDISELRVALARAEAALDGLRCAARGYAGIHAIDCCPCPLCVEVRACLVAADLALAPRMTVQSL